MNLVEEYIDDDNRVRIKRTWECCGRTWVKTIDPGDLKEAAWTPVCTRCGGFDGSFFI